MIKNHFILTYSAFLPFDQMLKALGNFLWIYLLFGYILDLSGKFCFPIEHVFIKVNVLMLKNNLAIWLHWDSYSPKHVTLIYLGEFFYIFSEKLSQPLALNYFYLAIHLYCLLISLSWLAHKEALYRKKYVIAPSNAVLFQLGNNHSSTFTFSMSWFWCSTLSFFAEMCKHQYLLLTS